MAIPLPGVPALVDNAITRKLDHAWFPAITGLRDLKGRASLIQTGAAGTTGKAASPFGNALDVTSSALALFRIRRINNYPYTMMWAGWFNNASDNWTPVGLAVESGSGDILTIRLINSSSCGILQQNAFSSTATFGPTITNLSANRVPVSIVAQSLSATDHRVYVNGNTATSSTNTGTFSPRHQISLFSGVFTGTTVAKTHNGGFAFAACGQTAFTEEEALWLSRPENIRGLLTRKRIWVPVSVSSGGTGSLAVTLDSASVSSAGSLAIAGALSSTLEGATLSSAGSVAITGSSAVTLADSTLSAAGAVAITGSSAITLGDATLSAAGALALTGSAAVTLDSATLAAEGVLTSGPTGALAVTLADATVAATGTLALAGTASITLAGSTLASTGTVALVGALSSTLDGASLAATGALSSGPGGALAVTLDGATLSSAGTLSLAGALAQTLDGATLASSAALALKGSVAISLAGASLSAVGGEPAVLSDSGFWRYTVPAANLTYTVPACDLTYTVPASDLTYEV